MQPAAGTRAIIWPNVFQSSSGQKAGCNRGSHSCRTVRMVFQSSSGQKAGCNAPGAGIDVNPGPVSILIRPEGRMQLLEQPLCGGAG